MPCLWALYTFSNLSLWPTIVYTNYSDMNTQNFNNKEVAEQIQDNLHELILTIKISRTRRN